MEMKKLHLTLIALIISVISFAQGVTVTEFPFTEGFDGETFPPEGWLNVATEGTYIYERYTVGE